MSIPTPRGRPATPRPHGPTVGTWSATRSPIVVAQPAQHPPQPRAARLRHGPAGDLRGDVPLRVRRGDPGQPSRRARPTSTTSCPGSSCRRSSSARSPPASVSPTTSTRGSSTGSGPCRWPARRCSSGARAPTSCGTSSSSCSMCVVGFIVGWTVETDGARADRGVPRDPRASRTRCHGCSRSSASACGTPRRRRPSPSRSSRCSCSRRRRSCPSRRCRAGSRAGPSNQPVSVVIDAVRYLTIGVSPGTEASSVPEGDRVDRRDHRRGGAHRRRPVPQGDVTPANGSPRVRDLSP